MPETTQFGGMNDANQNDGALQANTILLARYKIEGQLGGGGQGAVYQARDLNFPDARRLVAIKEMLVTSPDPNLRAQTMKTFQREANILATLGHPAIPKIYDFFDQNDRAYLVMEYINGRDLEAILVKTKTLPMDKIVEWGIDLCDVLQYLHSHQPEPIIFRDMKPANIMIDSLGKVRLIDFGIAKIFVSGLPQTMIGTEGYSAPEQYKGRANPLSDVYSLGATLHHVITRTDPRLQPPFSFSERPITELNSEASPELAAIIEKMLEFDPANRYQTCAEVKEGLLAVRYGNTRNTAPAPGKRAAGGENGESSTGFFADGRAVGIEPRWTFKVEDEIRSSPVGYRNLLFVGSYDTNIWGFNMEDGTLLWKKPSDGGIASSPVIDTEHKLILSGSEDYTYTARDMRDGRLTWTYTTGDKIRGTGRIAHGHVFFGSDDGKLYALIASNGRFLWEYETASPIRSTPFVTNDRIIFGNEAGEVIALELNGNRKWGFRTRRAVTSSPIVDRENICYIGSMDSYLYALDADNSYTQWRLRTNGPIIASPDIADGFVYITSTDGKLYCANAMTGKERWTFDTGKPIISSPRVFNGVVYFGGTDKKLHAVDAKSGKELWSFEAGGQITSTPFVNEQFIIFGSLDRTVYALPLISN
jgi:eukaryotic-like serine/threonine-protein kinase